jgi:Ca2+-binding RTX toxin-like protein
MASEVGRAVRGGATLGLVILAVLVAAPAVNAATVTVTGFELATLAYDAAPGETNHVTVSAQPRFSSGDVEGWIVRESGYLGSGATHITLVAGAGCTSLDSQTAFCPMPSTEALIHVLVTLGDLSDVASIAGACGYTDNTTDFECVETRVDGGAGYDDLVANDAAGATCCGDFVLLGGDGGDLLYAGDVGTTVDGGAGGDWLFGAAGRDTLRGGSGNDRIAGGPGRDILRGGTDRDTLYARDRYPDVVGGGGGRDRARVDRRDVVSSIEGFF